MSFKIILSATLSLLTSHAALSQCHPDQPSDQLIYRDFQIFHSKDQLKQSFNELYQSERRLKNRVFLSSSTHDYQAPYDGTLINLPKSFLLGVSRHIEKALKNSYIDYLFYPDMGHGHLYLPKKKWEQIKTLTGNKSERLLKALHSPSLKILYHTAELLQIKEGDFATGKLPSDPWKLWRYFSRNLLGHFNEGYELEVLYAGDKQIYNTVREIKNHVNVSIFYMSSTKKGCLSYSHSKRQLHYDLSFSNIPWIDSINQF